MADESALGNVLRLIRSREQAAQLCIVQNGRILVNEAVGCRPDALFWIFSAGKPFVALLIHLLAQRGALSRDDVVARFWPAFGRHGKDAITIRQVLGHRSGLASACGA